MFHARLISLSADFAFDALNARAQIFNRAVEKLLQMCWLIQRAMDVNNYFASLMKFP